MPALVLAVAPAAGVPIILVALAAVVGLVCAVAFAAAMSFGERDRRRRPR